MSMLLARLVTHTRTHPDQNTGIGEKMAWSSLQKFVFPLPQKETKRKWALGKKPSRKRCIGFPYGLVKTHS